MKRTWMWVCLVFASLVVAGCNDDGGGGGNDADKETTNTTSVANNDSGDTDNDDEADADADAGAGAAAADNDSGATSRSYNLTGRWVLSGKTGVYRLAQNGASVQGFYMDTADPDVGGAIAGSVAGTRVELNVVVEFASHPEDNFTAHKSGTIKSRDRMELYVTRGPSQYFNHRQVWFRY